MPQQRDMLSRLLKNKRTKPIINRSKSARVHEHDEDFSSSAGSDMTVGSVCSAVSFADECGQDLQSVQVLDKWFHRKRAKKKKKPLKKPERKSTTTPGSEFSIANRSNDKSIRVRDVLQEHKDQKFAKMPSGADYRKKSKAHSITSKTAQQDCCAIL